MDGLIIAHFRIISDGLMWLCDAIMGFKVAPYSFLYRKLHSLNQISERYLFFVVIK